jgi:hypothetical protein
MVPVPMPELAREPFAFQPAIVGVAHNEWILRRSSWTELVVVNTKTSEEISVARRFLADITDAEMGQVARLTEPLEYCRGLVLPVRRGVIMMPEVKRGRARSRKEARRQAAVLDIRVEAKRESLAWRALRGTVALGFLACLAAVVLIPRLGFSRPSPLEAGDDYYSVVNKLGRPATDRWIEDPAGGGHRRLTYPRRKITVVLQGETRETARYAAAAGRDAAPSSAVPAPSIVAPALP